MKMESSLLHIMKQPFTRLQCLHTRYLSLSGLGKATRMGPECSLQMPFLLLFSTGDCGARRIWDIRGITAGLLKKNIRLNIPLQHLCVIIMWENCDEFLWSWVSRCAGVQVYFLAWQYQFAAITVTLLVTVVAGWVWQYLYMWDCSRLNTISV